jgi:hypothetical protein
MPHRFLNGAYIALAFTLPIAPSIDHETETEIPSGFASYPAAASGSGGRSL